MLYDSRSDLIKLKEELRFLRSYIDLQLQKDPERLNVTVHLPEEVADLKIAPMVLLPFIENAFKHSQIQDQKDGWVDIFLKVEGQSIDFRVRNSVPAQSTPEDTQEGVGTETVRRRLNLLYPNRHTLYISRKDLEFSVFLKIW